MTQSRLLRPSGAPVWVNCPGAPDLWQSVPPDTSDVAREGIAAHWLAEMILTDKHTPEELIDRQAPNGVFISEEMVGHVALYVNLVRTEIADAKIEATGKLDFISPGMIGTPDASGISRNDTRYIKIPDLKYGWRIVEAFENWQLICYASMFDVHDHLSKIPLDIAQHYGFEFIIVQPRASHPEGPIRRWKVSLAELREKYWPRLQEAAKGGDVKTGPWCRNCNAAMCCPSLREATAHATQFVASPVAEIYTGPELATELTMLEAAESSLNARIAAIREMAIERITATPNSIPTWDIDRSRGTLHWSENADLGTLEALTGKTLHKPKQLTPKQAVEAGCPETIVNQYSERSLGKSGLVPVNPRKIMNLMGKAPEMKET